MKFIALTPTKGGQHEAKSMYLNVDRIDSLDSEITDDMLKGGKYNGDTKTVIELKSSLVASTSLPVAETVQEIMDAMREAEDL